MTTDSPPDTQIPEAVSSTSPERASGRSIAALVLGILSVSCTPLGAVAWILGQGERNAIRKGKSPEAGWGIASAGWILGIIFTALTALAILLLILFFSFGFIAGMEGLSSGGFEDEFFQDF